MDTETTEAPDLEAEIAAEMGEDDVDQQGDDEAAAEILNDEDRGEHVGSPFEGETLNVETGELTPTDESTRRAGQDSEREAEKAAKRIDTAKTTYAKKVAEVMGEDFALVHACPLCTTFAPGFRFDTEVPEDVKQAVRVEIGLPDVANYKQTEAFWACQTCGGLGAVATGSQVVGKETHRCHTCQGKGYQTTLSQPGPTAGAPLAAVADDDGDGLPNVPPDADPWGRVPSDPLYGVMPGYER